MLTCGRKSRRQKIGTYNKDHKQKTETNKININPTMSMKGEIKWSHLSQGVLKWSQEVIKEMGFNAGPHQVQP